MNFKLKTPNSKTSSLILFYAHLADGKRFVYSTGQKLPVRLWDRNSQLPRKTMVALFGSEITLNKRDVFLPYI